MSISIGPSRPEDAPEIASLYLAARADALPYLRRVHEDDHVRAWIRDTVLQRGVTLVARRGSSEHDNAPSEDPRDQHAAPNGQILGFLALVGSDLDQLYVLPGVYRRGVGSQLLARAKFLSPDGLHLYTFQKNAAARAFYEKHGFHALDFSDGQRCEEKEPDMRYEWAGDHAESGQNTEPSR